MPRHEPFPTHRLPLVGMVHLPPLPGAPGHAGDMQAILSRVVHDVEALSTAGFDGVIVENYGDTPFYPLAVPPETIAAMTLCVAAAVRSANPRSVGVNVLRNDAGAALGIAAVTGAAFIRVNVHAGTMWTDQGAITGQAHRTLRERKALMADVGILTDVHVKHAVPTPGRVIEDAARDLWERAGSDGLIVSGAGTGAPTAVDTVARVRRAAPEAPLWIGSGTSPDAIDDLVRAGATGFIVGSWVQRGGTAGNGVDPDRARAFVDAVRARGD